MLSFKNSAFKLDGAYISTTPTVREPSDQERQNSDPFSPS